MNQILPLISFGQKLADLTKIVLLSQNLNTLVFLDIF